MLVPEGLELYDTGVMSLDSTEPMGVRFIPHKRHVSKNMPAEERQSKAKREMAKVVEKLKCRDASQKVARRRRAPRAERAHSDGGDDIWMPRVETAETAASKRPRIEHGDHRPTNFNCCIHGDPCELGPRVDDLLDRFGNRLATRWEQDLSGMGFLGRLARALVEEMKKLGYRSESRSSRREEQSLFGEHSIAHLMDVPIMEDVDVHLMEFAERSIRLENLHDDGRDSEAESTRRWARLRGSSC